MTPRERYYIEGLYYSKKPGQTQRSIDAYTKCVAFNSADQGCRHNLALDYSLIGRYAESAAEYEELLRRGSTNVSTSGNLISAYRALGEFAKARTAADALLARLPENASAHVYSGDMYIVESKLDDALAAYRKAAQLNAASTSAVGGTIVAFALRGDWGMAESGAAKIAALPLPSAAWLGHMMGAVLRLHQGRSREGLQLIEQAIAAAPQVRSAVPYGFASDIRRERGDLAGAVTYGQRAVAMAQSVYEEPFSITVLARARARGGRRNEAEAALARATRTEDGQIAWLPFELAWAQGTIALDSGDASGAIDYLSRAVGAIWPRGSSVQVPNAHVPMWYELARAYQLAGRDRQAVEWFERITTNTYERFSAPLEYTRSFYFLGQLYEKTGDATKARAAYARFVDLWKDGDLDRDRIADARRRAGL
jgi:tetratricopeptide (TPR) repeat protein